MERSQATRHFLLQYVFDTLIHVEQRPLALYDQCVLYTAKRLNYRIQQT